MDELLNAVEEEKENRFQKQWTKLDKGTKLNRLTLFIEEQSKINELNEDEIRLLKKLLFRLCQNGSFNKSGEIDYSEETYQIINIKNLKYDENKKKYSFDLPKKTIKPSSKSKSNIDRHFSRSKGNKK